jgi:hypothetical protein
VALNADFGDFGCPDTTWRWTPLVLNTGSAPANSVVLTLRRTAGEMTVLDSVVTVYDLDPDSLGNNGSRAPSGFYWYRLTWPSGSESRKALLIH